MFDRNRFRPQLERLEDHVNPAMYWDPLGTDLSSGNPLNWCKDSSSGIVRCTTADTPTSPLEDLIFGAWIPVTYVYQYGGQQQTIAAHQSNADCVLSQASQYTTNGVANYRGVTLLSAYTKEIDLRQSANVTALDVRSGKIKQNDQGTVGSGNAGTLTVVQTLDWTGGTINSNTVPGAFVLASTAAGSINPGDGNTVTLGDTLTLKGNNTTELGAVLTHHTGVWKLSQGTGIVVEGWANLNLIADEVDTTSPPSPPGSPLPAMSHGLDAENGVKEANGKLLIKSNGEVGYYPKATTYDPAKQYLYTQNLPIKNDGGTLTVKEKTDLKVTESSGYGGIGGFNAAYIWQMSGTTLLEAGSMISAIADTAYALSVAGGTFSITKFASAGNYTQPDAIVDGNFQLNGESAVLNMPGPSYNRLKINGFFRWNAGTVSLAIAKPPTLGALIQDQIVATGEVYILNTHYTALRLRWDEHALGLTDHPSWDLIKSEDKITGAPASLTCNDPNFAVNDNFELATTTDKKTLFVRRK